MSSSLSLAAREDVEIDAQDIFSNDEEHGALVDLWNSLRHTNADVALSSAKTVWEWIDSCIYVAAIKKLVRPPAAPEQSVPDRYLYARKSVFDWNAPDKSRRYIKRPWGRLDTTWRAPKSLAPIPFSSDDGKPAEKPLSESQPQDLAYIAADLERRVVDSPVDIHDIGTLRKYAALVLKRDDRTKLYHVYLFDRMILFVREDGGVTAISPEVPTTAPLRVEGMVHLADVIEITHTFTTVREYGAYGVELLVRLEDHSMQHMTLVLPTSGDLVGWSAALRQHVFFAKNAGWSFGSAMADVDVLVDALAQVINWQTFRLPLAEYGPLRKYAPVTIKSGAKQAECGAYLFDRELLFIVKTQQGTLHLKQKIDLSEVISVSESSVGALRAVGLTVQYDDGSRLAQADYVFAFESRASVGQWLFELAERAKNAEPEPAPSVVEVAPPEPEPPRHPLYPTPERAMWYVAGLVFLAPSTDGENEYNVGVGVLPPFQADGLATHAVAHALSVAFETLGAHRVQARILHAPGPGPAAAHAACRFVHWGFAHEGTRRRAVMHPAARCWADMSVLALIDSDWIIRDAVRPVQQTLWDEMFARHQREREGLLLWEGGGRKRTRSMETVRNLQDAAPTLSMLGDLDFTDTASSAADTRSVVAPSDAPPPTLPPSDVGTGTSWSSWAAVADAPGDIEPLAEQVRRWMEQQAAAGGDPLEEGSVLSSDWDDLDDEESEDMLVSEEEDELSGKVAGRG